MTSQTLQTIVGSPTLPRVNLLPPEIAEARVLRQYRLAAGGAVLVAVLGVGGLYWHAHTGVADAQASLTASQSKTATLTSQVTGLQSVTQLKAQVQSAQATLTSALAPQILWSKYMQDMSVALAGNYWFNTVVLSSTSATAAASSGGTPFSDPNAVGTASFTGKAVSQGDVSNLLAALAAEKGLSHPTLATASEDTASIVPNVHLVNFTAGASIDATGKSVAPAATPSAGTSPTSAPTPAGH